MLDYKWNKILSDDLIENVLTHAANKDELYIFNKLKEIPLNKEKINKISEYLNQNPVAKVDYGEQLDASSNNIYEKIKSLNVTKIKKAEQSKSPKAGDIWLTKRIPKYPYGNEFEPVCEAKNIFLLTDPIPYVSDNSDEEINKSYKECYVVLALPISFDTKFATEEDYVVKENNSILGISFMIETGLEFNALSGNLEKFIGRLSESEQIELMNLYFKTNKMDYDKTLIPNDKIGKPVFNENSIEYLYKKIENENIKYLEEPVNMLDDFFRIDHNLSSKTEEGISLKSEVLSSYSVIEKYKIEFASTEDNENDLSLMHHETLFTEIPKNLPGVQFSITKADGRILCAKINSNIHDSGKLIILIRNKKDNDIIFENKFDIPEKGKIEYHQITGKLTNKFVELTVLYKDEIILKKNLLF
jgi:hypothetical protein